MVQHAKYALLQHFLAALAYRTQKALRDAPDSFAAFRAGQQVRSPHELVRHMRGVLHYARAQFDGNTTPLTTCPTFAEECAAFFAILKQLDDYLQQGLALPHSSPEQLLQGPFADAMTHAGQLAMLRRLAGAPIPPENFHAAAITRTNLGPDQPPPVSPDAVWPEAPPSSLT